MQQLGRTLLCAVLLAMLAAAGCKPDKKNVATGGPSDINSAILSDAKVTNPYPIATTDRPFKKVHPSVEKAWFLVETGYFVIKDKYRKATGGQRDAVEKEVEKNIFEVNDKVEALFKDAIKAEPDNPLNYAAYAVYLKPRKRLQPAGGYLNCESEALDQIDKALKIWPDEWSFYLLKVWTRSSPNFCDDWYRGGSMEELAIAQELPKMEGDFKKAEQYCPDNAFVNYYHALTIVHFTDPEKLASVRDQVMREVRAGNQKPSNYFFFPPPLLSFSSDSKYPRLFGTETGPKYVDQWLQFGTWDYDGAQSLFDGMSSLMKWPADKQDISDLMYCAYALGRALPYDRSFFNCQQRFLDKWLAQVPASSDDRLKLAEAARFLGDIYREQASKLITKKMIKDQSQIDVAGIASVEGGASRLTNVAENLQAPQAAYLKKFGEIFGIKFPLPEDTSKW